MEDKLNHTQRGLVIELSVKTEYAVNLLLTKLLGINPDDSRSFGTSSHALSFNAKANLLLDLNKLDKLQREKFQIFMEIRNKFAHLNAVDTFEKCFAITGNYEKLKKIFEVNENGESLEIDMETMFCILSMDITLIIGEISKSITKEMAVRYTQKKLTEVIKERRVEYQKQNPLDAEAIEKFIVFMKNNLLEEVDEKIKIINPPYN